MKTLEQRIVRVWAEVPTRATEEPRLGESEAASTVHFCLERSDGTLLSIGRDLTPFTPPPDDSTIVVIKLRPERLLN